MNLLIKIIIFVILALIVFFWGYGKLKHKNKLIFLLILLLIIPFAKADIKANIPNEWKKGETTIIYFQTYLNESIYSPIIIDFEFQPINYFEQKNITEISTGNFTTVFFTKEYAIDGEYQIIIKSDNNIFPFNFTITSENITNTAIEPIQNNSQLIDITPNYTFNKDKKDFFTTDNLILWIAGAMLFIGFLAIILIARKK